MARLPLSIAVLIGIAAITNAGFTEGKAADNAPLPIELKLAAGQGDKSASPSSEPIIGQLSARRVDSGAIIINGSARLLPAGTKLWIRIPVQGSREPRVEEVFVEKNGQFQTRAFNSNSGLIWNPGEYMVTVESRFTRAWQPCDVLKELGVETDSQCRTDFTTNPTKLPQSPDLVPYDPEFPTNSGRLLKIQRQVNFPKLSGEDGAINAVKNAKLIVQGKGKSGRSVIDIIQKLSNQYFVPLSWSAKQDSPDGPWIVTLNCIDGGKQKTAQWEYNPETETIKYLDPLAKLLSFL